MMNSKTLHSTIFYLSITLGLVAMFVGFFMCVASDPSSRWAVVGPVLLGGAVLFGVVSAIILWQRACIRGRKRQRQCVKCGYSRIKLEDHQPCPECGMAWQNNFVA